MLEPIDQAKVEDIRKTMEDHSLHKMLKQTELHVVAADYVYLKLGNMRFYFHGNRHHPVRIEQEKLVGGQQHFVTILPYDGWEVAVQAKEGDKTT